MKIHELVWPEERIEHIAEHGVTPEEVEEVCFGKSLVLRAKSEGKNPVYYVLGQTKAGRYLFCVVIRFPDGVAYPVSARPMRMEESMKKNKLPKSDSIAELARFWDRHDITDFEDELEEVTEPVFENRPAALHINLEPGDAAAIRKLAKTKGVSEEEIVASWIRDRLSRSNGHSSKKRSRSIKPKK